MSVLVIANYTSEKAFVKSQEAKTVVRDRN